MKTISWLLIMSMFLSAACSSTRFVEPTEPSYDEVNEKFQGKKATITLMDNQKQKGQNAHVTPDSTSWLDLGIGLRQTIATSEVKKIVVINHGTGALKGLRSGAIVGSCIGLLAAIQPSEGDYEGGVKLLFVVTPILGFSLLGLLIGAGLGARETYVLNQ